MHRARVLAWLFVTLVASLAALIALIVGDFARPPDVDIDTEAIEPEDRLIDRMPPKPRLFVVLDDAGHAVDALEPYLALPGPLTFAVLPRLAASTESARLIHRSGHEVILHQPMEPHSDAHPGPGTLSAATTAGEVTAIVARNLATVPHAVGLNNHMGSSATENAALMHAVVAEIQRRDMLALDSRTSAGSVFAAVASERGVPVAVRNVFLDNERNPAYVSGQLDVALDHAREHGGAIMIGHVTTPLVAEVLAARWDELTAEFEFAPITEAVLP